MPVTLQTSGSQVATVGTEHTLADISIAGTFSLKVDMNVLAAGDVVELRWYQIVLTGGTRRVVYMDRYFDAQAPDDLICDSIPISNDLTDTGALRATLKQTFGTSRTFPWAIMRHA